MVIQRERPAIVDGAKALSRVRLRPPRLALRSAAMVLVLLIGDLHIPHRSACVLCTAPLLSWEWDRTHDLPAKFKKLLVRPLN